MRVVRLDFSLTLALSREREREIDDEGLKNYFGSRLVLAGPGTACHNRSICWYAGVDKTFVDAGYYR